MINFSRDDSKIYFSKYGKTAYESAIFTNDISTHKWFIGPSGTDCGIGNINAPTNGAEIGELKFSLIFENLLVFVKKIFSNLILFGFAFENEV